MLTKEQIRAAADRAEAGGRPAPVMTPEQVRRAADRAAGIVRKPKRKGRAEPAGPYMTVVLTGEQLLLISARKARLRAEAAGWRVVSGSAKLFCYKDGIIKELYVFDRQVPLAAVEMLEEGRY